VTMTTVGQHYDNIPLVHKGQNHQVVVKSYRQIQTLQILELCAKGEILGELTGVI
jgi:hypothetical protein